ncbi:MAG: HipA domain-containing protein [Gammaproteobacteria bacterium]|nr:HipA domain-containing protein [Gammaproteobacteria bacterium]MBU2059938.1 HipA domain-containing protein [Gammaproteobacteria bacterium]MBU2175807.1 HipA domain-containing protein [Gammaproteobacteria bacterium]MBU2247630.1 HipA domain-containing protein [Gammaproteobacteria bacterium]MBU2342945.1 HipA domain-containing protein [Gammaproteobacteria bacterium]
MQLTLQLFNDGFWQDAYQLRLDKTELGRRGTVLFQPLPAYARHYFDDVGSFSFSAQYPVNPMDIQGFKHWPAVFDDIMPMGYGRTLWLDLLGLQRETTEMQDLELLRLGTIAPVGNMRIKEAIADVASQHNNTLDSMRFPQNAVIERDQDFLNYARQRGAVSGGATGAGGAAPKLLIRLNKNAEVWVDTFQNDDSEDLHYLVKFPRGNKEIDRNILRTEYHYYCELAELGFDTMQVEHLKLLEGERNPSLWLPRFDREFSQNKVQRFGLESVFSLLNKAPGSYLNHEDVLDTLSKVINTISKEQLTAEYLKRDLLNLMFGNTDNHGRNSAVLKKGHQVSLAPVYDFAPMKADPETIVRTTHWSNAFERGGDVLWLKLCDSLADFGHPDYLKSELCDLAGKLSGLTNRLRKRGVPEQILTIPAMGFDYKEQRLQRWGLLP